MPFWGTCSASSKAWADFRPLHGLNIARTCSAASSSTSTIVLTEKAMKVTPTTTVSTAASCVCGRACGPKHVDVGFMQIQVQAGDARVHIHARLLCTNRNAATRDTPLRSVNALHSFFLKRTCSRAVPALISP